MPPPAGTFVVVVVVGAADVVVVVAAGPLEMMSLTVVPGATPTPASGLVPMTLPTPTLLDGWLAVSYTHLTLPTKRIV